MNPSAEQYCAALRTEMPELAARFGVSSLALFGSRLRDDARPDSDLDVLVEFHETPSLFRLIDLENHLSDLLSVKVDLVIRSSLKPRIGQRILGELAPI